MTPSAGLASCWPPLAARSSFGLFTCSAIVSAALVAIQEGHTLVTNGIYSIIRNPSYLGLLINMLGWSLAFRSIAGVLLTALMLVPLVVRMNAEERLLQSEFGAEYDAYRARTSRLIPGLY